jgi:hypothetical protein
VVPPHWATCHLAIGPIHVTATSAFLVNFHMSSVQATTSSSVLPHVICTVCHIIIYTATCHPYSFPCHHPYFHSSSVWTTTCHPTMCHFHTMPHVTSVQCQLSTKTPKRLDTCQLLVLPCHPVASSWCHATIIATYS